MYTHRYAFYTFCLFTHSIFFFFLYFFDRCEIVFISKKEEENLLSMLHCIVYLSHPARRRLSRSLNETNVAAYVV